MKDPERFGVPEIKDGRIVSVEEKPSNPKSSYAVAGIYLYDHHIFEAVKAIKPSARGELEISDAHQYLIDKGYNVGYTEITGWWKDTGKPTDLLEANRLVLDNITASISEGEVDARSVVAGKVIVETGRKIINSVVRGPAIIGEGCVIEDAYVGPFSSIGNNTDSAKERESSTASSCGTARSSTSASVWKGASSGMMWRSSKRRANRWCTGS